MLPLLQYEFIAWILLSSQRFISHYPLYPDVAIWLVLTKEI